MKIKSKTIQAKRTASNKVEVLIIESERGWGQRIDEVKTFPTLNKANAFIKKFNSRNNLSEVPDWYMYATLSKDA